MAADVLIKMGPLLQYPAAFYLAKCLNINDLLSIIKIMLRKLLFRM